MNVTYSIPILHTMRAKPSKTKQLKEAAIFLFIKVYQVCKNGSRNLPPNDISIKILVFFFENFRNAITNPELVLKWQNFKPIIGSLRFNFKVNV